MLHIMDSLGLLFFVSYVTTTSDLLFTHAESSDMFLVKSYNGVWCAAQGETAYSALSWSSSKNTNVYETEFRDLNSPLGCNLMKDSGCELWSGWSTVDSLDRHMPPVLDYRWNDFRLIATDGKKRFSEENNIPIYYQKNVTEITLSMTAEHDAYILLCEGLDPNDRNSGCYWIILGGWPEKKDKGCAIRRCPQGVGKSRGPCEDVSNKSDKIVKSGVWTHVTLKIRESSDLSLEVSVKNQTVLQYSDPEPFNIKYLNVRSNEVKAYFRIHKYKYLLGNENDELTSKMFEPESTEQCWSIVYSLKATESEEASLDVQVQYENSPDKHLVKKLNGTEGEWQHEKFILQTKETASRMKLIIIGRGQNKEFAVGGIQQCSLNGDTRTSKKLTASKDHLDLTCQALKYVEREVTLTSLNYQYKDCEDCTMNCKQLEIPEFENSSTCFGTSLCKNTGSDSVCFCSAGYSGDVCNIACQQSYGVNCKYKCGFCKNAVCNHENGTCGNGCEERYRPPLCQTSYLVLNKAPELNSVNFTSVFVSVKDFSTNGDDVPAAYKLQYTLASQIDQEDKWITEGTYDFYNSEIHNVTGLEHATEYAFRAVVIDRYNGSYDGKDIPYSVYRTNCSVPEDIDVEAFRNSISVGWKLADYSCPIKNYTLKIEKDGRLIGSVSWQFLPFNVTVVKPFTNYTWKLLYNDLQMKSGMIQTLEDVPSEVQSLTIDALTQTSLIVKWESPEHPNGIIKRYRVQYEHCKYLTCADGECSSKQEKQTDFTSVELVDLKPYSMYNITVTAYTIGYGTANSGTGSTSGYGFVDVMPKFVEDSPVVKQREVELKWELNCTIIMGKIIGYTVTLKAISEWVEERNRTLMVEKEFAKFENVQPYSRYSVSILVHGEDGPSNEEYALVEEFRTKPAEPGKVRNAVSYSYGESWIYLRWKKPYPPTGELEHYKVMLSNTEHSETVKAEETCLFWEEMVCAKLENLESNVDFTVTIVAKNKGVKDLGEPELLQVTTKQGVPDPPLSVITDTLSPRVVLLKWKHPNITRGRLTKFEAKITLESSGLRMSLQYNKTKQLTVNKDRVEYTLKVDDLHPASKYYAYVRGFTVASGESSTVNFTTPVSVPDIGSHLDIFPGSVTDVTFEITVPKPDKYMTNISAYILIVTSENKISDYNLAFNFKLEEMRNNVLKEANVKTDGKSWIAAEIKPGKIKRFKIGDNKTKVSDMHFIKYARNRPLAPGGLYQVTLVAVNLWNDDYKYSAIKLQEQIQTLLVVDDNSSIAAWIVVVLLILCIAVLVVWFIKRRRGVGKQEINTLELRENDTIIVADTPSMLEPESSESKLPPSQRFSRRVVIGDLEQYVKTGLLSGELQRQHELFPRGQTRPWDYGRLPENKTKNRYGNLVAYDETRVKLKKLPGDQFSDYINANYINGYNSARFYIATQGPKRNTVTDFWRMIWQEHVQVIVMLTNIIEETKIKCEKYWPEFGQEVTHGAVTILNASNQIFADYTFRQLNVSCKGKTRKVHHLHFTSWPDHGVPMYPQSLASFHKKLLATSPGSGPIVVHCSAGVGRTGTVVLSDICLRMAAAEGYVDMLSFLQQIREQRANMVDNLDQYKLVHLVLLECLVTEPSSYPCDASFDKRVQELSSSGTIRKQFNHLYEIRWQDEALRPTVGQIVVSPSHTDSSKNRNLDIVPGPNGRVYISPFPYDDPNSDYINAVYVDGFQAKDQFIVTQFPLESTVSDFWRLITEKKVPLIVVLNEMDDEDKSICQFWPLETSESMNPVPHITVTKKQEHNSTYWKTYDINITTSDTEEETRTIHILHLKDWRSDEKLPPSTSVILELWQETERLYKGSEPIAVCCFDGATACGYFVALAFLIEKIKLEQQCDVCQAVRTVRQNREHFVPICDQFEYLYKAAVTYLDSFQIYANFS